MDRLTFLRALPAVVAAAIALRPAAKPAPDVMLGTHGNRLWEAANQSLSERVSDGGPMSEETAQRMIRVLRGHNAFLKGLRR